MKLENTKDLSKFMDELKEWSKTNSCERFLSLIESAERNSYTASELIIKYGETLRALKIHMPDELPQKFKDQWDLAIEVCTKAVLTVEYEEKDRPLFSFG